MTDILILCANPADTARLRLDYESRQIQTAIQESPNQNLFNIHTHFAVRASDLQSLLLRYTPDIVHFTGHGTVNGGVILEDSNSRSYVVSTSAFVKLFQLFGERTKCVIFNTNYSSSTANAISEYVDYVIGMQGSLSDEAAIEFSTSFYRAIAYGRSVEEAFQMGRNAVELASLSDEGNFVLISRSQTDLVFGIEYVSNSPQEVSKREKKQSHSEKYAYPNILGSRKTLGVFVGVNTYNDPFIGDLTVCVDDVTAVHTAFGKSINANLLCTGNSELSLPTRNNIISELLISARAAEESDLLLFYYSGHGFAENSISYLIATDTQLSALKYTAISMNDVVEIMQSSEARAKVIILDACHSGANIGKSTSIFSEEFIAHIFQEAEGTAILSSCKQGEKSWEWADKNRSVFTYYLLQAIGGEADVEKKGFITITDAHKFLTNSLKVWSKLNGLKQTPTLETKVVGDIILVPTNME